MLYTVLLPIRTDHNLFKPGIALYSSGLLLYFLSWYSLSGKSNTPFFHTAFAQLAPSYLPILWFAGIALMSRSIVLPILSGTFLTLHITEYAIRFTANVRF
jgi:hypothetical protein